MDQEKQAIRKQNRFLLLLFGVIVPVVTIGGFFIYLKLSQSTIAPDNSATASQESFSGSPQLSAQLQSECQQSAEKLVKVAQSSVARAAAEYSAQIDKCREVSFALPDREGFRAEGNYPDLILDLARLLYKSEPAQARQLLVDAKNLPNWEYVSGPLACDSSRVLDAYIESMSTSAEEKKCVNDAHFESELMTSLRSGRFETLINATQNTEVVQLGAAEAGVGCPAPASELVKLLRGLSSGTVLTENKAAGASRVLVFRAQEEDKVVLEFRAVDSCYYLESVFISGLQQND